MQVTQPDPKALKAQANTLAASLQEACALLAAGQLVAFPTETVYGLGADASNTVAIGRLYQAKGRPTSHPVIVHIASPEAMTSWATTIPGIAWQLAETFWPGPLTLLLPKAATVSDAVTGGKPTVALRCPAHPVALELLGAYGKALVAPSANCFGKLSPTLATHVRHEFSVKAVPLILDGGPCSVGVESTILDLSRVLEGELPVILRPGQITAKQLSDCLGQPILEKQLAVSDAHLSVAPGTLTSHYAPEAKLLLMERDELQKRLNEILHQRTAVLSFSPLPAEAPSSELIWQQMPGEASAYARDLYARLRHLDAQHPASIWVELPDADTIARGNWQAILDRLRRASA